MQKIEFQTAVKELQDLILEYDADLELYNHGTTYKGNIDISQAI